LEDPKTPDQPFRVTYSPCCFQPQLPCTEHAASWQLPQKIKGVGPHPQNLRFFSVKRLRGKKYWLTVFVFQCLGLVSGDRLFGKKDTSSTSTKFEAKENHSSQD